MRIKVVGESMLGTREEQQDAFLYRVTDQISFAVVCDGMGGLSGGSIASQLVVKTFKEDFLKHCPIQDVPAFLHEEALRLDQEVYYLQDEAGEWLHAGTTIVVAVIINDQFYFMSVGDSRLFMRRGSGMLSVTREHNYRLQLEDYRKNGIISEKEYQLALAERGEALISYLGYGNISVMDVSRKPITLLPGDRLLLCSDGLTKIFSEEELKDMICRNQDIEHCNVEIKNMIHRKQIRNQDNTTYVLVELI